MSFKIHSDEQLNNFFQNLSQNQYQQSNNSLNDQNETNNIYIEQKQIQNQIKSSDQTYFNKREVNSNSHSDKNKTCTIKNNILIYTQNFEHIENQTQITQNQVEQEINENTIIDSNQSQIQINGIQKFTLFEKNDTKIEQILEPNQKQLRIKKYHLSRKDLFHRECRIFELLKGNGITLDIIKKDEINLSFEQISGKSDLFTMHQKSSKCHVFEVFFLIMLEKLNQMHKHGIAHADIKPQNIIISYQDEPFFIDFDSSVLLSDYQNYLKYFTYNFNLNVYVQQQIVNNQKTYKIKKFQNEEEIKLCDKTQLALTFLYLLCENRDQIELFYRKDYNELISSVINRSSANGEIIVSTISRILNQADSTIKIIGDDQKQIFLIDHSKLNEQLSISNDIIYYQEQDVYHVNRIDDISVKSLYFLDKMGCKLQIIPFGMTIIHQPDIDEYNFICQKYLQINEYLQDLINYKKFVQNDLNNLFYYLNKLNNQKCKILLNTSQCQKDIFNIIKKVNIDTLSIKFKFSFNFLEEFLKIMSMELPEFIVKIFKYANGNMKCKIMRRENQKQLIQNVKFILKTEEEEDSKFLLKKFQNFIKNNKWQIQSFQINYKISKNIKNEQIFQQLEDIKQIIELVDREQFQIIHIYSGEKKINSFEERLKYCYCFDCFGQRILHFKDRETLYKSEYLLNQPQPIINQKQILGLSQQNLLTKPVSGNTNEKKISQKKEQKQQQIESITCKILKDSYQINNQMVSEFSFMFKNHTFYNIKMWQEIKNNIQNQANIQLKLVLIECFFSNNVIEMIKEIFQEYSPLVKSEFNQYEENYQLYSLKNDICIKYNIKQSNQYRLNIVFFIKTQNVKQQQQQIQEQNWLQSSNQLLQQQQQQQQLNIQRLQKFRQFNENQTSLQSLFPYTCQNLFLQNVGIPEYGSTKISAIQQKNQQAYIQINNNEIENTIIEKIKKKIQYSHLQLFDCDNCFIFSEVVDQQAKEIQRKIEINFTNSQYILSLFQKIFAQIDISYNFFQIQKFYIKIDQSMRTKYFSINQTLLIDYQLNQQEINDSIHESQILKLNQLQQLDLCELQQNIRLTYQINFDKSLKHSLSQIKRNLNLQEYFYNELYKFQQEQNFYNSYILNKFGLKNFIIQFNFDQNIDSKLFIIMFLTIEEIFTHNQIFYRIGNWDLTKEILFKLINKYENQIIKFSLFKLFDKIDYFEIIKFINMILKESLAHTFLFEIRIDDKEILQQIKNKFQYQLKIYEDNCNLTLIYQPKIYHIDSYCVFTIILAIDNKNQFPFNIAENNYNTDDFEAYKFIIN